MTAYLIVIAEVDESSRKLFDQWYETKHLSDAKKGFRAISAMRGWSGVNPGIHTALYEFSSLQLALDILDSQVLKDFINEFDQHWKGRASRRREVVNITQAI